MRGRVLRAVLRAQVAARAAVIRACCQALSWDGRTDTDVVLIWVLGGTRPSGRITGSGLARAVEKACTRCIGVEGANWAFQPLPCWSFAPDHHIAAPSGLWWYCIQALPSGLVAVVCSALGGVCQRCW